ncbi:glycosyltransferase family 2 protein [Gelidibacter gilvus]|uniref:Glycosyltransferase family 2 protein n=1 Tax=Gelidibacter gilvus TaxID=59602 RepID=A0A4Q0XGW6_9FLAO|nr:glycosyltransferase family 2 protein [Gelidibacter gilvus]RXJ46039.1 glycosyltransferase family 2 protein [Gelidibacter gilvus]
MFLVSVIIPMYNSSEFIKETLNSVSDQTYKDIEIIVVDDNSTDGCFELVNKLNRPNLKLVKNPRKGACAARNYGFEISKGEYIQYLDADDLLSPNKIHDQMNLASKFGLNAIYFCEWIRFVGFIDEYATNHQFINKNYDQAYMWLNDSWSGKGMAAVHSWLVPRQIIIMAGQWNEDLLINQDGEFFTRVLVNASSIKYATSAKVYYRSGNPDSISQSQNTSWVKADSLLNSLILNKKTCSDYGLTDELKEGLGYTFLNFIYRNFNVHSDLVAKAKFHFYDLGYMKMWPVGGENFKKGAKLIGFLPMLKIKSYILNVIKF